MSASVVLEFTLASKSYSFKTNRATHTLELSNVIES